MCFWYGGGGGIKAEEGLEGETGEADAVGKGPTGTMREPNSTPMVTSWTFEKRFSQRRIVREDLPVPESPMQTSLAM